jgi:hypothetical protein
METKPYCGRTSPTGDTTKIARKKGKLNHYNFGITLIKGKMLLLCRTKIKMESERRGKQ